ncbi:MAG: hypothetical protein M1839_009440 [Geoglossum umbratile]|nr:MAG: hypothetical protein M1839_009440 [Geoglossum umbratile]
MTKQLIAVIGATGYQGRGVIDALTTGKARYDVRPLTRNLNNVAGRRFIEDYPELHLMEYNWEREDSICYCLAGCYGVFFVTENSALPPGTEGDLATEEYELGMRIADAAWTVGVQHLVYTSLQSIYDASNGRLYVHHFESKNYIGKYIRQKGLPTTLLYPGPFYTNFNCPQYCYWAKDVTSGKPTVIFCSPAAPNKLMGWVDAMYDIGSFVRAAFDKGPAVAAKDYPANTKNITYESLASLFTAVTGVPAIYRQLTVEEFVSRAAETLRYTKGSQLSLDTERLAEWFMEAPNDKTGFGTMPMSDLEMANDDLGVQASPWEEYLERSQWMGPPRKNV